MSNALRLSPRDKLKFNPLWSGLYRRYFKKRALETGEPELRILDQIVPKGSVALDVGSNKGVYTYLMAEVAGHVHAFEPNPVFYERLNRTRPANASCHNLALSDQAGSDIDFYLPLRNGRPFNQIATLRDISAECECLKIQVETQPLDGLVQQLGIENIGFIKIDVEGWEQPVLDGARKTIARDKPILLIEVEERHTGRDLMDALADIEALGYETRALDEADMTIKPLADFFDIERDHRAPKGRYINNFFFVPKST